LDIFNGVAAMAHATRSHDACYNSGSSSLKEKFKKQALNNKLYSKGFIMPKKFNVLDHELVPKHVLLSREEAERILKSMGLRKSELPWIFSTDPVARTLRAKPGDVIMIIRKSPTASESVAFRLVMRG
jgi:DNA-directed RNA polymerase subunit H